MLLRDIVPFNFAIKELHQLLKLLISNANIRSIWHGALLNKDVVVLPTHIAKFLQTLLGDGALLFCCCHAWIPNLRTVCLIDSNA